MSQGELVTLLGAMYRDKRALWQRHVAGAEHVAAYEVNNTYQYVIERESTHVAWLRAALEEVGGEPSNPRPMTVPEVEHAVIEDDARTARAYVDRWRGPVEALSRGRHRTMLEVILGETLEHKRFFDQASAGRTDLLGRRPADAGTGGGVLPHRWVE